MQARPRQYAKRFQDVHPAGNNLCICKRTCWANKLAPYLMELAHAAFLRTLISKHGAGIKPALRQGLCQPVRYDGPHRRCRTFGAQSKARAAPIFKAIGFFGHHIRARAKWATKYICKLKNRRRYFSIAKLRRTLFGAIYYMIMSGLFGGKQIAGATNWLNGLHRHYS